ncbi:Short-chain dehydrogenase TIC 32 chloroplastic [Bienertia sinuspersici]
MLSWQLEIWLVELRVVKEIIVVLIFSLHLRNNAGVFATPFTLSQDNIELQFATNHLGKYSKYFAYCRSKLANVLHANELARHLKSPHPTLIVPDHGSVVELKSEDVATHYLFLSNAKQIFPQRHSKSKLSQIIAKITDKMCEANITFYS